MYDDVRLSERRQFLRGGVGAACALGFGGDLMRLLAGRAGAAGTDEGAGIVAAPARHYRKEANKAVTCLLCPRECAVADVERGYCGVRENRGGDYHTLVYGALCSANVDPIEKKPLFHYLPSTTALSVATAGCNMECKFCQNWQISQFRPEQIERSHNVPPERLATIAKGRGCPTIAYTYSEPVVFNEYVHDAAEAGRKTGVGSVMISNGYIQEKPLRELCRQLTGMKVDLKGFTEKFYKEQCAARLGPVLEALETLASTGIHFEIVVLLIPTLNDSSAEIQSMAKWIVKQLGPDVPIHFSRFHPTYRLMNLPPTPVPTLTRARKIAMDAGNNFVYVGNVPSHPGENTYCSGCQRILIRRMGYRTQVVNLNDGRCGSCRRTIPGVWTQEQALAFAPRTPAPDAPPAAPTAAPD